MFFSQRNASTTLHRSADTASLKPATIGLIDDHDRFQAASALPVRPVVLLTGREQPSAIAGRLPHNAPLGQTTVTTCSQDQSCTNSP